MPTPTISNVPRFLRIVLGGAICLVVALVIYAKLAPPKKQVPVKESPASSSAEKLVTLELANSTGALVEQGYILLEPPIRLPGRASGRNKTEIFLRVPKHEVLLTTETPKGPELDYPPGTHAMRVESVLRQTKGKETWSIADIRATRFATDGQYFQVFRPISRRPGALLRGVEWKRGDASMQARADDWVAEAARLSVSKKRADRTSRKARSDNSCERCHVSARADATRHKEFGPVHRGTDAGGLFVPRTILANSAPLESYAPLEQNKEDPFVEISCAPPEVLEWIPTDAGERGACSGGTVPLATLLLDRALEKKDTHAARVCDSRKALLQLLSPSARATWGVDQKNCYPVGE